jgi:hypothetical protein
MKLREQTQEQLTDNAFKIFNGGEGLDHWSYSSTSTPFAKNLINYTFPQEVRRKFPFRHSAHFGNLVNNTVQRLISDVIYTTKKIKKTEFTKKDRDYNTAYQTELKFLDEKKPVDKKDEFARKEMLNYVHDAISETKKVVQEILGKEKMVCERFVEQKEMTMIKPIIGRIDYETKNKFIELKTKPPRVYKTKGKEEWTMRSQDLPSEPLLTNITQTSFYYMATKKIPYLVYVNDKGSKVFDSSHELLKPDHLEYLYFKMVEKILLWEKMIMFCEGSIDKLALMCEPPDMDHFFYYKDLTKDQENLINKLWGIKI